MCKKFINMFKKLIEDVPIKFNVFNLIFIIAWTLMDCYFVSLLSKLVADATSFNSDFLKTAITFIIFIIGWGLLEFIADVVTALSCTHIENNAFVNSFEELYTTSPATIKKANSGYVSGLLHKLMHKKQDAYMGVMEHTIMALFYTGYTIFYLSKFHWAFSLTVFVFSILGISVKVASLKFAKNRVDELNGYEAERTKIFMDAIINISTVQKLRSKSFFNEKMADINQKCLHATKRWSIVDEMFFCSYKVLMYMVCPACLIVMFFLGDNLPFDKIEFLSYLAIVEVKLLHYTKNIADTIKRVGLWKILQNKVDKITADQDLLYTASSIEKDFNSISIKNASHTYVTNDKESVTVNIPDFEFNKGDFVCIYGESGQGKTTTLNLLSGDIQNDFVMVDNKPINKNLDAVYVAQDIEMFDMSLRDNLLLGSKASDEELVNMIYAVGMGEWFENQDDKLDTILGERGVFISTGQRQRLNLIRGLLIHDKEIYFLDEPTSNVDEYTEKKIVELLKRKLANKTVIIVTHKNEIKKICNKIYHFENGIITLET